MRDWPLDPKVRALPSGLTVATFSGRYDDAPNEVLALLVALMHSPIRVLATQSWSWV